MERQELRSKIPHGYSKIIAEKAGVSTQSVSLFLKGKSNSLRIEMAALEIIAGLEETRQSYIDKINHNTGKND